MLTVLGPRRPSSRARCGAVAFLAAAALAACGGGASPFGASPRLQGATDTARRAAGVPIRVAASPAPTPTVIVSGPIRIEGLPVPAKYTKFDGIVGSWMTQNGITAAQLAFAKHGKLLFFHAYTNAPSNVPTVTTQNVFRLASLSKMMPTAATTQLLKTGAVHHDTKVFRFLGVSKPLLASQTVDPRIHEITLDEVVNHTSGIPGEASYDGPDPLFSMRDIELNLGSEPLTKDQFVRYIYGTHLDFNPGSMTNYSNSGYVVLGKVVEKATNMAFLDYMNANVFAPLGIAPMTLGSTVFANRNPLEVVPDDEGLTGPSVFDLSANPPQLPFSYGGGDIIWEDADSASDFETSADSIVTLIHHYNVYGLGGRAYDLARDGCVQGVTTWAESMAHDIDFAVFFNKRSPPSCLSFNSTVINDLRAEFEIGI